MDARRRDGSRTTTGGNEDEGAAAGKTGEEEDRQAKGDDDDAGSSCGCCELDAGTEGVPDVGRGHLRVALTWLRVGLGRSRDVRGGGGVS